MVAIYPAESVNKTISEKTKSFRWMYITLPAAILLISIILAASFYSLLPREVAYHFEDGAPDRWMSRGAIIAWMIIPQFFLVVVGVIISVGTTMLSTRAWQTENTQVRKISSIMGNMVVLPQIILTFAILDIFLYNAYRIHLISVWVFALIVIVLGDLVLGIFFIRALKQLRKATR